MTIEWLNDGTVSHNRRFFLPFLFFLVEFILPSSVGGNMVLAFPKEIYVTSNAGLVWFAGTMR